MMGWRLLLLLVYFAPSLGFRRLVTEFVHNGRHNLSHLAVDPQTNQVYIGGTNVLYQLDNSLRVKHKIETGPVDDSHLCGSSGVCKIDNIRPTDNHNKLLVIDKTQETLVACGSVKQGICRKYKLTDITDGVETLNHHPVAANNKESSTFGFIGPQKYNPWSNSDVLYVGTTFTNHGDYRYDVPAISSRNLFDMSLAEYTFSTQSKVNIDVKYRRQFLVDYVYGFNSSSHVYFLTVQKKSYQLGDPDQSGYITRISRSCIVDSNFDTYSEVTLECSVNGNNYNLLQAAVLATQIRGGEPEHVLLGGFSTSQGPTNTPRQETGFCAYSLKYIDRLFDENIHMCFNGTMHNRNLPYISGPIDGGKCPSSIGSIGNINDFCQTALKISGPTPIHQEVGLHIPNTRVTSLSKAEVGNSILGIIGTSTGDIIKVLVSNGEASIVDTFRAVQQREPIISGLMHTNGVDLLVLTPRRIRRLKMADCSAMQFCGECLGKRDPFCGWCSLENECSLESECSGRSARHPAPWLNIGSAHQCIHLESISPSSISVNEMTNISLQISSLPALPAGDHYLCLYNGRTPTRAVKVPGGLVCPAPPLAARPPIPPGTDHVTMQLAVTLRSTVKEFVTTPIHIFNCDTRSTCLECVSSLWPCAWCIYGNRCSHMVSNQKSCKEAIVSADTSVFQLLQDDPSQLISRGSQNCPRVQLSNQLFIPNSVPQELRLTVSNLPDLGVNNAGDDFLCEVEIEDAKFRVPATLQGNQVLCERTSYKYQAETPMHNASISVLWDANHVVDRTNITLYKCGEVGSYKGHADCSLCMTRAVDLGCVWCGSGCEFTKQCPVGQSDVCPQPRIDVIKPLSGPVDGGTEIIIEGSNLATGLHQLKGRVMLGNVPCEVIDYKVSVRIQCRTGRVDRETDLAVRLRGDNGIIESSVKFRYRDLAVTRVIPNKGPRSGGTVITVEGVNLNIGSSLSILLDNIPCEVNTSQISSSRVTCTTGAAPAPLVVRSLALIVDDARRTLSDPYEYTPDPTIRDVSPKWSFVSGGRVLTVYGNNLDTVEQPYIAALDHRGQGVGRSACTVLSSTQMNCPSPAIVSAAQLAGPLIEPEASSGSPEIQTFRIGFEMDRVTSLLNLSTSNPGLSELLYVKDPVYDPFLHGEKTYKGDALVIEGYNLDLASTIYDLDVRIGTGRCNVTSLTRTQMLCIPPLVAPAPLTASHPEVIVRVGKNLRYEIGLLRYDTNTPLTSPQVIGGLSAFAALLLFFIIGTLIVLKHQRNQAEREYKRIQIQMDTLENNVRSECKQAFAELQTDMSDLTDDLEVSGIPLLDHRTFIMKVFFPGVPDHPLYVDPRVHNVHCRTASELDLSMRQFEGLLGNKQFLLTFIDTLEKQKTFSLSDRHNVASLIMIVLITQMEFCTDIIRCLLVRLLESNLNSRTPLGFLQGTTSIVDKMLSNWLAVIMYDYMKDYAGSSLFVLFKAIKIQIEKGPVDFMTHAARYSLSEDFLLREQNIEPNTVVCCVVQDELEEQVQVRVLDCDTISQVKAKILDALYKNTPFSLRPLVDEVDLEWRCGQYTQLGTAGGTLVLQDIDITSKNQPNNLRRLNTLSHYGLKERALVSLVPKQIDSPSHHIYQAVSVVGRDGVGVLGGGGGGGDNLYHYATTSQHYSSPQEIYQQQQQLQQHHQQQLHQQQQQLHHLGGGGGGGGVYTCTQLSQESFYHFVQPDHVNNSIPSGQTGTRGQKVVPEMFLTRLISTKALIQKFVDDFFGTILKVPSTFPAPVKWLLDLLDEAAIAHNVNNPEVVHSWKSACLPRRFWINFIKNPDFIFDVNKTETSSSCLSVIAQTFMDSCSLDENVLGKDSPSSKLLFAKDIPLYRNLVLEYYNTIQQLPQVTDQELNYHLQQLSSVHLNEFDNMIALKDLYIYVSKYYVELMAALEADPASQRQGLAQRLKALALSVYPRHHAQHHTLA